MASFSTLTVTLNVTTGYSSTYYPTPTATIVKPDGKTTTLYGAALVSLSTSPLISTETSTSTITIAAPALNTTAANTTAANTTAANTTAANTTAASAITANTTAASTTAASSSSGGKFGSTTIAGVAVACIIGGAAIAGILVWLIMSRRQKKRSSGYGGGFAGERHRPSRTSNEKALPNAPLLGGDAVGNWMKHLDQPESDNTIMRSVKGLFDHIEVHVENFYRDAQIPITHKLQEELMAVESSRELPEEIAGLLPMTERPTMLIKHCLTHSIVEHITFESDVPDSFLPTDFTALPRALITRRTTANKRGTLSPFLLT
jgi:hypothetical protein